MKDLAPSPSSLFQNCTHIVTQVRPTDNENERAAQSPPKLMMRVIRFMITQTPTAARVADVVRVVMSSCLSSPPDFVVLEVVGSDEDADYDDDDVSGKKSP